MKCNFLLIAGLIFIGSFGFCRAQTMPAGQLSRQRAYRKITPLATAGSSRATSSVTDSSKVAPAMVESSKVTPALDDNWQEALSKLQAKLKAATPAAAAAQTPPPTNPGTVVPPPNPEVSLSVKAARDRAAAAAKDANNFVTGVKADLNTATSQAVTSSDYAKITDTAIFANSVVAAADVATGFSNLAALQTDSTKALEDANDASAAADIAHSAFASFLDDVLVKTNRCAVINFDSGGNAVYAFKNLFPLVGKGCNDAAVLAYYNVAKTATIANQAQYFYNAAQSTNQVNADLLTTTFSGGVQVVLAGTATAGSSQPAVAQDGTAATSATTDSVATAVSKLEQGGDFNLRLAYPLAHYIGGKAGFSALFLPNLGFAVNGLSSQSTITQSTEYSGNIPVEFYGQFGSIPNAGTAAVVYADAKVGGDFVSSDFASKIGTNKAFFLGQFSAGIEFAKSVRIGFQYFLGPKQAYCVPDTGGCTAVTDSMSGVHLVVSFTPPSS